MDTTANNNNIRGENSDMDGIIAGGQQENPAAAYLLPSTTTIVDADPDESWSRHVEMDEDDDDDDDVQVDATPPPVQHDAFSQMVDDEDDEDNWSQQVETDDILRMPSSLAGDVTTLDGEDDDEGDGDSSNGGGGSDNHPRAVPPRREEPTMKERLVERERQRRVETERARWKRQFAMAAHTEAEDEEENNNLVGAATAAVHHRHHDENGSFPENEEDGTAAMMTRETNSVAGTVGDDTVAPIETFEDESSKMNYPMERFLQEQENPNQQDTDTSNKNESTRDSNQGVVMERFLQESSVGVMDDTIGAVNHATTTPTNVQRSVSFDTEHPHTPAASVPSIQRDYLNMSAASSIGDTSQEGNMPMELVHSVPPSIANASTTCLPPSEDDQDQDVVPPSEIPSLPRQEQMDMQLQETLDNTPIVDLSAVTGPVDLDHSGSESPSQPRVLRLTEAEIQEMEAIDEASRSNAPPSERDDMSELGELVSDFGGPIHMDNPNNSQGTPTTAMESASSVANHSGMLHPTTDDQLSIDGMGTASVSSHVVTSSVGGDASVAANPPSELGREDEDEPRDILVPSEMVPVSPPPLDNRDPSQFHASDNSMPRLDSTAVAAAQTTGSGNGALDQYAADETIVNRTMRPGFFHSSRGDMQNMSDTPSARLKKASSFPDNVIGARPESVHLDGFDFDKNDVESFNSPSKGVDGDMLLRNDMWSSGLSPTNLNMTPNQRGSDGPSMPMLPEYGIRGTEEDLETQKFGSGRKARLSENVSKRTSDENDERSPLLGAIPGEVSMPSRNSNFTSFTSIRTFEDINSLAESVFSDVRSEGSSTVQSISNEAKEYLECSIWQRAFPERLFALSVTLLFEIPVLLMVSGGSDRICYLIGRTKYQLLLGFLPLSSAISGNVGLQASTLTTRAISHGQVKVENYKKWLFKEIGAACYLGLGMGTFLGIIAFCASGYSVAFCLTVMIAQFISILTAGCTGTFAPLLFTFIFERDSGKWGGPLETAVQDIVGSFAMVIISYQFLLWMGPYDIAENDTCGVADLQ